LRLSLRLETISKGIAGTKDIRLYLIKRNKRIRENVDKKIGLLDVTLIAL